MATDSDQIIIEIIAMPQPRDEKKKGFLKRSGLMKRKGKDTTQKTMNPTICCVVAGTFDPRVLGTFWNEGHIAVMQTLCDQLVHRIGKQKCQTEV